MPLDVTDYRELIKHVAYEQAKIGGSSFFFDGQDRLRLRTFGSLASVVLSLEGRFLSADGRLHGFAERHVPTSDRTVSTTLYTPGEGFLLNAQVRASSGAPLTGQTFAIVEVVRGLGATVQSLAVLFAGYVTSAQRIGWPGSTIRSSTDGPGVIRSIAGTDPAAPVEISETVPTGARWRFLSMRASLVTDANAANRVPVLTFDDGTTPFAGAAGSFNQAASLTFVYHFSAVGANHVQTSAAAMVSTPANLILGAGFRIRTIVGGLQAGDNWGAPQLLVEEWIEG